MQITSYLHTAVQVTNLEAAEHFYGDVLGLSKVERSLRFPGAWYQIGAIQIHLIVTAQPAALAAEASADPWGRRPHLAFAVADLQAASDRLTACGYPLRPSASGRPALFTQDPDGNVIELSQLEPSLGQPPARKEL